jgi:hypothetical protein
LALEDSIVRLKIPIDLRKKALFERLCVAADAAPPQVFWRYIEERTGQARTPTGKPGKCELRAERSGARSGGPA